MTKLNKFLSLRRTLDTTGNHIFTDAEFEQLAGYLEVKKLRKKEFFNLQNEHARFVAYVNQGCLRAFHTNDVGDEFTVFFAFPGMWAGDKTSLYSNRPSSYSIHALEDSEIVYFEKDGWEEAMELIPALEAWYRLHSRRTLEAAQRKLIEWQTLSAEEKYLRLHEDAPDIVQRIPQHYIASYFGIKPQSLSRIRKKIMGPALIS
ncbi:Crp/Fnr family transcriptional regulator [Spirosoma knui]